MRGDEGDVWTKLKAHVSPSRISSSKIESGKKNSAVQPFSPRCALKTVPGAVYVCGTGEAELYGLYGFLQREADDRFYFPGELGEIVRTGEDLPLQKLDYTAGLGDLRCFIAAKRSDDPFARHLDFCVKQTEELEEPVRPNVFRQHYLNRMFGATTVQWYMLQAFAGKDPEKSLGYALKTAAGGKDPLVLRRVELFDVQLKQKGD